MSAHPDSAPSGVLALAAGERRRLAGILARLASPYESERAAAGLLASAFLAKHGLAWADLAALAEPTAEPPSADAPPRQDRRRGGARAWRGFCRRRLVLLGQALDRLT